MTKTTRTSINTLATVPDVLDGGEEISRAIGTLRFLQRKAES